MITFVILIILWTLVWLLHLNSLPAYRRQNPCHLPPASKVQRSLLVTIPSIGLASAYLMGGLDGLFLWAFTAPVTGILLGMVLPLCLPPSKAKT